MFKTSVNPFSVDLFGDKVELGAEEGSEEDNLTAFTCDKGLLLKPDMSTLRQSQLCQSQAFVIADPFTLCQQPHLLSPRQILKK